MNKPLKITPPPSREPLALLQREPRQIVVVVGMHRSGTSLCSNVLSMLGVDMASDVGIAAGNEKGHWERWEIVNLQDRVLKHLDRDYFNPRHDFPLPAAWWADPAVRAVEHEIRRVLASLLSEGEAFGFKDPRTARLLPMWRRIFRRLNLRPKYVFCLRRPSDVARSLAARDGLAHQIGEYRCLGYIFDILANIGDEDICAIEYDSWFEDRAGNLDRLRRFLGVEPPAGEVELHAAIAGIVDAGLNHSGRPAAMRGRSAADALYERVVSCLRDGGDRGELGRLASDFRTFQSLTSAFECLLKDADREAHGNAERLHAREAELQALRVRTAELEQQVRTLAETPPTVVERLVFVQKPRKKRWKRLRRALAALRRDRNDAARP